jgi:hypothetical protein
LATLQSDFYYKNVLDQFEPKYSIYIKKNKETSWQALETAPMEPMLINRTVDHRTMYIQAIYTHIQYLALLWGTPLQ